MGDATRRPWCRPELIVLVRGAPEEAVLIDCKNTTGASGYSTDVSACYVGGCGQFCFEMGTS